MMTHKSNHINVLGIILFVGILFPWPSAVQASSEAEWKLLNEKVVKMLLRGKPKEATPLALEAVKQAEEVFGPESHNVKTSLGLLSMIYQSSGEHEKAKAIQNQMAVKAKASMDQLFEKAKGIKNPMAEKSKDIMGQVPEQSANQQHQGQTQKSSSAPPEQKLSEAGSPFPGSQDQVNKQTRAREMEWNLLMQKATMLSFQGKPKEAIPLALEAVTKAEEVFGPESQNVQASQSLLSTLYQSSGEREKAKAVMDRMAQNSAAQGQGGRTSQVLSAHPEEKHSAANTSNADPQEEIIEQARAMGMGDEADALQKMREAIGGNKASKARPHATNSYLDDVKILNEAESRDQELLKALEPFKEGKKQKVAALSKMTGVRVEGTGVFTDADVTLSSLTSQGQYLTALPIAERAVKHAEDRLAPGSQVLMMRRSNLAQLYLRLAMYEKAEPLFRQLLEMAQRDSEDRAQKKAADMESLKKQGSSVKQFSQAMRSRDPSAARYFEKSTVQLDEMTEQIEALNNASAEQSYGPQADYLYSLAQIYHKLARYNEADQHYQRAVELSAKGYAPRARTIFMDQILLSMEMGNYAKARRLASQQQADLTRSGSSDASQAILLDKKAQMLIALGRYQEAEQILTKALKMWKETVHDGQEVYFMNRLAQVYRVSGRYTEAQSLYTESLKLSPKQRETIPLDGTPILNDLAQLQQELGLYTAATLSNNGAKNLQEKALGLTHPDTAATVMKLGQLYQDQGEYEEAKKYLLEAKSSFEERLGAHHPSTATSLMSLAELYHHWGKYEQAKPLYERALQIREEALLPEHLDIAASLTGLAQLYQDIEQYAEAERFYQRALQIYEKVLGPEHPDTGASLRNLADVSLDRKNYQEAEQRYRKALSIFEKAVGRNHPATATALVGLGRLRILQNQPEKAFEFLKQAVAIEEPVLLSQLGTARENRKLQLLERAAYTKNLVIALVEKHLKQDETATRFALELLLARKALVFDDQARLQEAVASGLAPSLRSKWIDLKQQITTLEMRPPAQMSSPDLQARLGKVVAEFEQHEAQMAVQSHIFSSDRAQRRATIDQLAKVMPAKSILIEFTKAPTVDWTTLKTTEDGFNYLAFVLKPDQTITLINLGDGSKLEKAIQSFQASTARETPMATTQEKAQLLYEKIWAPLRAVVGEAKTVIISPDAQLNFVPFAAMQEREGSVFLIEQMMITYVTSGRDLLREPLKQSSDSALVLVANPRFDDSTPKEKQGTKSLAILEAVRSREATGGFDPLPGTQTEADSIPSLVRAITSRNHVLTQAAAHEAAVLAVHHPRILHLATHGYFLPDNGLNATARTENVLLRSGLALAGANNASSAPNSFDGLLTAYEASGMDLQGTDLVVLSACQTGVGVVRNGDGVYGLRRVFALAGAKNLVMSLWRVDDAWTARQMEQFYKAYGQGRPAVEALRTAQLTTLAALRKEGKKEDPKLWAPFIVQGVPREGNVFP